MEHDNPQLHDFIETQRKHGVHDAAIAESLRTSGWPDDLIGHALGGTVPAHPQAQGATIKPGFFSGRLNRVGYVMTLVYFLAFMLVPVVASLLFRALSIESPLINIITLLWGMLGVLAAIPISISAQIRRWHDLDQSGWLTLLVLVPFAGLISSLLLLVLPGTNGKNAYGHPYDGDLSPKAVFGLRSQ